MGRLNKAVNISRKRFSALIRRSRGSHWKCLAMRVAVCCLAVVTQAQSATEYQVKAAFLFNFGTGPIRGFAMTLFIGLVSNLFTSIFVSKTLFELELSRRHQVATLSI